MRSAAHSWMRSSPVAIVCGRNYTVVHFPHWVPIVFIWARVSHRTVRGFDSGGAVKIKTNSDWWSNDPWWNVLNCIRFVTANLWHSVLCFSTFSWDNRKVTVEGFVAGSKDIYSPPHTHTHANKQAIGDPTSELSGVSLVPVRWPVCDRLKAIPVS